jgi:TPR repeat protein
VNRGAVKEVRLSQFSVNPPITRIVIDAKERVDFQMTRSGNEVVIEIPLPKAEAAVVSSGHPVATPRSEPVAAAPPALRQTRRANARSAVSHPGGAYGLMAKARALTLEDLQGLEDQAAKGDPDAQTRLALAYHAGVLLKKDDAEALLLLHKAADKGFAAAEESLGIFAQTGVGIEQPDPAGAIAWYKKAVQHGAPDAATNMALMYANGNGVAKDPAQALSLFRRAAEGGDAAAQYNLALLYDRGEGVAQDHKESLRWLNAAADQNVIPALLDLGRFSLHPPEGEKRDADKAIGYYTRAGDLGSPMAQAILGNIYANGVHGNVDYEKSVEWYRKAAEKGQPDGQFGLGVRYALGQGVPEDPQEAMQLFTAAAAQGQPNAQFNLATMYEEGKGTAADPERAAHYYQLAADQGFVRAQFRYGVFLAKSSASSDKIAAYKWFSLAQSVITQSAAKLSELKSLMNAEEIAEADKQVEQWRKEHPASQP